MVMPCPELDAVLADLVGSARDILGDTFVGAYVQGSFALGAGDLTSDCDFVVATTTLPAGPAERRPCVGPPVRDVVDEVPPEALRAEARAALPTVRSGIREWAPFDIAWTQRYVVSTYCRVLYTLHTAEVTSKRGALEWARDTLDPAWRPLRTQVIEDRALGWDPDGPPRPGSLGRTYEFAAYAESRPVRPPGST